MNGKPQICVNLCNLWLNILLLLTFNFLLLTSVFSAGTTSANFLKIPVGVRNVAMGETGAVSFDANSIYYNPAGLGWMNKPEVTFTHNQHFRNIYYEYFSGATPVKDWGTFGAAVYYLGMNDFQGYNDDGNLTKKLSANDTAVSLSYGNYVLGEKLEGSGLCLGANVKYISETLDDTSASTIGFDFGSLYTFAPAEWTLNNSLCVGAAVQNLGGSLTFESEKAAIPMNIKVGLGYAFLNTKLRPVILFDVNIPDDAEMYFSGGGEIWLRDILALRAGYVTKGSRDTDSGIRFGVGIKGLGMTLDYAYSGFGDLGNSHRFGLTVNFETPTIFATAAAAPDINKIYQRGVELFNQKRYPESILEFNKVLELDPTNKDALDYMKKANIQIKK